MLNTFMRDIISTGSLLFNVMLIETANTCDCPTPPVIWTGNSTLYF